MATWVNDSRAMKCTECQTALGHDQRYCVQCGTRRGPLPRAVDRHIQAIATGSAVPGDRLVPVAPSAAAAPAGGREPAGARPPLWPTSWRMPSPHAAAVAVMALLAFGVIVGWTVRPSASTPGVLLADMPPSSAASSPAASPPPTATPESAPEPSSAAATPEAPASPASTPSAKGTTGAANTKAPAGEGTPPRPASALPPVKHVFLIVLSEHGYSEAFGAGSSASYLTKTLLPQGELLSNYYAVTQGALANGIALISGQGPTLQTAENCPTFAAIAPHTAGSEEQILGSGCVYPAQTLTVAGQLSAAGKTWKAYVEGVAGGAPGQAASCRRPALGAVDPNHAASAGDPYVTWRNPFVYFDSLTEGPSCTNDDVGLNRLTSDLKSAASTPSLAYIVPDRCHDGSEQPCTPGAPAGLAAAGSFLSTVVPEIQKSPAFKEGGLIGITFDQAPQSGAHADPSACCETPQYPNLGATGATGASGATGAGGSTGASGATGAGGGQVSATGGGGRVGLLLISPYVKAGSVDEFGFYNHFSLLRSIEDLFGLKGLGYAGNPALPAFDKLVYNAPRARGKAAGVPHGA